MATAALLVNARVVLVTGSTSGIGAACARAFAQLGDLVVVNSKSSVAAGERLARELEGAYYLQGDVKEAEDCARIIDTIRERSGRLDVLVNNAGTTRVISHRDLESADVTVWREIFEVNVFATWQLSVRAMELLRASRGSIVNVSSIAGVRPTGSSIPYAASKAALNHLTALLAAAVGPEVRVNAVAPGLIDTPWTESWDEVRANVERRAPLRRSGKPDDVARVIVSLAQQSYVTGQVLVVDGGLSLT